jgi:hypothetical protein
MDAPIVAASTGEEVDPLVAEGFERDGAECGRKQERMSGTVSRRQYGYSPAVMLESLDPLGLIVAEGFERNVGLIVADRASE